VADLSGTKCQAGTGISVAQVPEPRRRVSSRCRIHAVKHEPEFHTKKPVSFAHVARTPNDNEEELDDSQGREQDLLSGRCGTRTHDLSRVKAAL
jgi:hypothetical protein